MKKLFVWIMICVMLVGCGRGGSEEPLQQESQQESQQEEVSQKTEDSQSESVAIEESEPSILDQAVPISEGAAAYYVPCETVEALQRCTPFVLGDTLLLYRMIYDDQGNNPQLHLAAVDLMTGEKVGEQTYETPNYISLQIVGGYLCMTDSALGWVGILDETLTTVSEYHLTPDSGSWYVSPDMQKLYSLGWDSGIRCIDLATQSEEVVLDNVSSMIPTQMDAERILVGYTDLASQLHRCQVLSLATGTLEDLSLTGQFYQVNQAKDVWFYYHPYDWMTYIVQSGGQTRQVTLEQGYMLLQEGGHLMVANDDATTLTMYDGNGGYLSSITIPNDGHCDGRMAWSEELGGYFSVVFNYTTGECQLMFWDLNQQQVGTPLALQPYGSADDEAGAQTGSLVSKELYERAAQLSEQYGLDIRIAEQCELDYFEFTADVLTEEEHIDRTLSILERTLDKYPEGFFEQLLCGNLTGIRIEIVHNLKDTRTQEGDAFDTFAAFVRQMNDQRLMVLDAKAMQESTIYHEFSHMIDARLEYDAGLRSDALYSEQAWLDLQPEGYEFPWSFADVPDYVYEAAENGYFISAYGGTYPTEDRAMLLEAAMIGYYAPFEMNATMMEKLNYYSACIRDCFDTTGWPAVTRWEEPLYQ